MVNILCIAQSDEGLADCAEVAHPKEVEMTQASSIEIALPQLVEDLVTDIAGITLKTLDPAKITVGKLTIFSVNCPEDDPCIANNRLHCY